MVKHHETVSKKQLGEFISLIGLNAQPTQPLNGRGFGGQRKAATWIRPGSDLGRSASVIAIVIVEFHEGESSHVSLQRDGGWRNDLELQRGASIIVDDDFFGFGAEMS